MRREFTIGMTANWKGQTYELVGLKTVVSARRPGREVNVLIWRSHCRTCGEPIECITPQRRLRFPCRHCPQHYGKWDKVQRTRLI